MSFREVLEDDVEIPSNWNELVNATLSCAPSDWSLLKARHFYISISFVSQVSGWGYSRASDLQQRPPGERLQSCLKSRVYALVADRSSNESCPDAYLMKRPFKERRNSCDVRGDL